MNIKDRNEVKPDGSYQVIAFTRIGVLSSVVWKGSELLLRLDGFHYEEQYDMWFYPGDVTGYDIRVQIDE